jgi:hypothetical protein
MYKKTAQVKNPPMGENWPNLVTVTTSSQACQVHTVQVKRPFFSLSLPTRINSSFSFLAIDKRETLLMVSFGKKWTTRMGTEFRLDDSTMLCTTFVNYRVARWFIFKPKIPIWGNFGGP